VGAFTFGAAFGGVALGALLGLLGSAVGASASAALGLAILAIALALGVAVDAGIGGLRLPTVRRQVNEGWLHAYRGWVYGLGFGVQLGLGVATIVTTSAVYVAFLAAFLSGSPLGGAIVGGTFGLVRAATVLPAGRVRGPAELAALGARLRRWGALQRPLGLTVQAILVVVASAWVAVLV
jgi:hypothetical protein